jgi:hypothetical protein
LRILAAYADFGAPIALCRLFALITKHRLLLFVPVSSIKPCCMVSLHRVRLITPSCVVMSETGNLKEKKRLPLDLGQQGKNKLGSWTFQKEGCRKYQKNTAEYSTKITTSKLSA